MRNWDGKDETGFCSTENDWKDVQMICDKLDIPLVDIDFVKQYWTDVFQFVDPVNSQSLSSQPKSIFHCRDFIRSYEKGETPNPDINCNKYIKFDAFFHYAREHLNSDAIATGHYARNSFGNYLENFEESKGRSSVLLIHAH